jgi:hypothetical protein
MESYQSTNDTLDLKPLWLGQQQYKELMEKLKSKKNGKTGNGDNTGITR